MCSGTYCDTSGAFGLERAWPSWHQDPCKPPTPRAFLQKFLMQSFAAAFLPVTAPCLLRLKLVGTMSAGLSGT